MILNILFLFLVALGAKIWTIIPATAFYTLQVVALLIIIYLLKPTLLKNFQISLDLENKINAFVLTSTSLLLIFSTGGAESPFFFMLYFLLFGIAFLFQPKITLAYSIILITLLSNQIESPQNLLRLFSLIFITPLALFFGKQYLQNLEAKKEIRILKKQTIKTKKALKNQETNSLLWLSLNFKESTNEILETTALMLSDISRLTPSQKQWLNHIRSKTKKLSKEGRKLLKLIDLETDEKK